MAFGKCARLRFRGTFGQTLYISIRETSKNVDISRPYATNFQSCNPSPSLAWLVRQGQAENAKKCMEELALACCASSQQSLIFLRDVDNLASVLPDGYIRDLACYGLDSQNALHWFFSRPWSVRLWVLQEVNAVLHTYLGSLREIRAILGRRRIDRRVHSTLPHAFSQCATST
jgi:hypothetical protein